MISLFPRAWFRQVYDAAHGLPPVQKKRLEEALNRAKRNKVIRSSRPYDPEAGDWLHNALSQQATSPFHAIIASENPADQDFVLRVSELDELHPRMVAPHDREVARDASSLAVAMALMLRSCTHLLFVDPYYDPFSPRYKNTLRECLKRVDPAVPCEVHHLDRDGQPTATHFEHQAAALFGDVIPQGMTVTIYRWREKPGGADFHARYLLTEKGGIHVDAGFSACMDSSSFARV